MAIAQMLEYNENQNNFIYTKLLLNSMYIVFKFYFFHFLVFCLVRKLSTVVDYTDNNFVFI
ncbi:hypothetical protein CTK_C25850 [Clostridium tyrobutyricum]|nr:hypothetical protein CTK_C25850 [Clostridium tyrobutyricum]